MQVKLLSFKNVAAVLSLSAIGSMGQSVLATPMNFSFIHTASLMSQSAIADTVILSLSNSRREFQTAREIAQVTGNLLSADQKAKLLKLPIPIVAPTYLPKGFQLTHADGEEGHYSNGDDDSGYSLIYKGPENTCIEVRSSKDGPRGAWQQIVKTRFGSIKVFTENNQGKTSIYSFVPIQGQPVLISGASCNPVSMQEYIHVLQSLELLSK